MCRLQCELCTLNIINFTSLAPPKKSERRGHFLFQNHIIIFWELLLVVKNPAPLGIHFQLWVGWTYLTSGQMSQTFWLLIWRVDKSFKKFRNQQLRKHLSKGPWTPVSRLPETNSSHHQNGWLMVAKQSFPFGDGAFSGRCELFVSFRGGYTSSNKKPTSWSTVRGCLYLCNVFCGTSQARQGRTSVLGDWRYQTIKTRTC